MMKLRTPALPRQLPVAALLLSILAACSGQLPPPQTRSIIVYSGERIQTTPERMAEVERWLRPQLDEIEVSREFLIRLIEEDVDRYPWDTLEIDGDTADIRIASTASDAETPFLIYAHLRLMQERGSLEDWAPETEDLEGFEVERAILARVADVWLLGRSAFDTHPFGPMDELLYAHEFGFLDDFILATQADRFPEEVARSREEDPGKEAEFRAWLQRTFERDQPGYIAEPGERAAEPS